MVRRHWPRGSSRSAARRALCPRAGTVEHVHVADDEILPAPFYQLDHGQPMGFTRAGRRQAKRPCGSSARRSAAVRLVTGTNVEAMLIVYGRDVASEYLGIKTRSWVYANEQVRSAGTNFHQCSAAAFPGVLYQPLDQSLSRSTRGDD